MINYFLFIFLFIIIHFSQANDLNGKWYVEIDIQNIGNVRTVMDFESDGTAFKAASPKSPVGMGASLISISDGKIYGNSIEGKFNTPSGVFNLKGEIAGDSLSASLYNKNNVVIGSAAGNKTALSLPLGDYGKIVKDIFETARVKVYSEELLQIDQWKNFGSTLTSTAKSFNDDIDLIFSFYMNAMKVPVSHLSLLKESKNQNTEINESIAPEDNYEIKNYGSNTVYLKISSFTGAPEEIDSLFKIILGANPQNLILDLRDNPGGSLGAGLRTAQYLAETDTYGGIFLTRRWFDKNGSGKIPILNDYGSYNSISIASNETFDELIHKYDALTIKLTPLEKRFNGKLFILTNNKTASTCEPLVAGLKQNKNTSVIGEKTAGKMMQSEKFSLSEGFVLTLPTADFYTPDGIRLERAGVKPTTETASDKALDYVLDSIK